MRSSSALLLGLSLLGFTAAIAESMSVDCAFLSFFSVVYTQVALDDEIKNLPGVNFTINFRQFGGAMSTFFQFPNFPNNCRLFGSRRGEPAQSVLLARAIGNEP